MNSASGGQDDGWTRPPRAARWSTEPVDPSELVDAPDIPAPGLPLPVHGPSPIGSEASIPPPSRPPGQGRTGWLAVVRKPPVATALAGLAVLAAGAGVLASHGSTEPASTSVTRQDGPEPTWVTPTSSGPTAGDPTGTTGSATGVPSAGTPGDPTPTGTTGRNPEAVVDGLTRSATHRPTTPRATLRPTATTTEQPGWRWWEQFPDWGGDRHGHGH